MKAVLDVAADDFVVGGVVFVSERRELCDSCQKHGDYHNAQEYAQAGVYDREQVKAVEFEPLCVAFLEGGFVKTGVFVIWPVAEG